MLRVSAPAIEPARGGLLRLANVIPDDGRAALQGVTFQAPSREAPAITTWAADLVDGDWDRSAPLTGAAFTIYRALEGDLAEDGSLEPIAREVFTEAETLAVEAGLQPVMNTAATDITPVIGTAIPPARALGLIEQYMGANYTGRPLLHSNRNGATILGSARLLWPSPEGLVSIQESMLANGAGYGATGPGALAATATQFWLYGTGQVNLWQGPLAAVGAPEPEYNQTRVLVQRQYVPIIEGPVAAVLVSVL